MYDRRLDAIIAAARTGSFSKAAASLNISTTALAKQVAAFEREHGLILFERSRQGVTPTPSCTSLVSDAEQIVRLSKEALARARGRSDGEKPVRLGVSLLCPGRKVLEAWPQVHALDETLRLELTPVGDLYDPREDIVGRLGSPEGADVIQTSYSAERWGGRCQALGIGSVPLSVDVARTNPLAECGQIGVGDLAGMRVRILRHANSAMDELRDELVALGADVVDEQDYDLALFNEVAGGSDAVVTSGAWSGMHPALVSVPLAPPRLADCALLYPHDPSPEVARFVDALARVLGDDRAC